MEIEVVNYALEERARGLLGYYGGYSAFDGK
jgi:hypothetical protein